MKCFTLHTLHHIIHTVHCAHVTLLGESVEENANLVVRLLIRRPECLGPALRGEGGGLLKAMHDSILMSLQIAAARDPSSVGFIKAVTESEDDDRGNFLHQRYLFRDFG